MSIKSFKYAIWKDGQNYPRVEPNTIVKIIPGSGSPFWITCHDSSGTKYCVWHEYLTGVKCTPHIELQYNLTCL